MQRGIVRSPFDRRVAANRVPDDVSLPYLRANADKLYLTLQRIIEITREEPDTLETMLLIRKTAREWEKN